MHPLDSYPAPLRGRAVPLGNRGGFSGARIFRVETAAGPCCLRGWPPDVAADRLDFIHDLLRRAAGLDFVPRVLPTTAGRSHVRAEGRLWDLTTWMPGEATFQREPTPERLRAACTALARLHEAWSESPPRQEPCPAVRRRLAAAADWLPLLAAPWQPPPDEDARRTWALVRRHLPEVPQRLARWRDRPVPVQPCLCDVWHDHVLFTGGRVTGLVDFGSCKDDHVAVDLARLLGSLVGDDAAARAVGLDAYCERRPLSDVERGLIDDLDRTGTVIAAANWLRWLYREGRAYENPAAARERLAALVRRVQDWDTTPGL